MSKFILVLEDDVQLRGEISEMFSSREAKLVFVSSHEEVFHQLSEHSVDIFLTDLVLNKKRNENLIKNVVTQYPGVAVILMSTIYLSEIPKGILTLVHDCVEKPFPTCVLKQIIQEVRRSNSDQEVLNAA